MAAQIGIAVASLVVGVIVIFLYVKARGVWMIHQQRALLAISASSLWMGASRLAEAGGYNGIIPFPFADSIVGLIFAITAIVLMTMPAKKN